MTLVEDTGIEQQTYLILLNHTSIVFLYKLKTLHQQNITTHFINYTCFIMLV